GLRGFLPSSQVARAYAGTLETLVGKRIPVKILEVNRKRNRLIVSQKAAEDEDRARKREELFSRLQTGTTVKGTVSGITSYGAFVGSRRAYRGRAEGWRDRAGQGHRHRHRAAQDLAEPEAAVGAPGKPGRGATRAGERLPRRRRRVTRRRPPSGAGRQVHRKGRSRGRACRRAPLDRIGRAWRSRRRA